MRLVYSANLHTKLLFGICFVVFAMASTASAQRQQVVEQAATPSPDFKIVTEVVRPGSNQVISRNQTLFQSNIVYDVRYDPASPANPIEFTIYEPKNHKFILLDVRRKFRLELDTFHLLRIVDDMRKELEANPQTVHLAKQDFVENFDSEKQQVIVQNDVVSYSAIGQRPSPDSLLPLYHDFLDQFTRLSSTNPNSFPPFARIRLNQSIKKYGFVPAIVSRTIKASPRNTKPFTVSTQHQLVASLSDQDKSLVRTAKLYWTQFSRVDLAKYRGIAEVRSDSRSPQ